MKILLTLFVLLFSSSVLAEATSVRGGITKTCEKTIKLLDTESEKNNPVTFKDVVSQTIVSYLSGINIYFKEKNGNYKNLFADDYDYIFSYVINHCRKNPEISLMEASLDYFLTLPNIK